MLKLTKEFLEVAKVVVTVTLILEKELIKS
jgi:hypothetical protein